MDYQKLYLGLFNAITDALEDMDQINYGAAAERLRRAQMEAEEAYLEDEGGAASGSSEETALHYAARSAGGIRSAPFPPPLPNGPEGRPVGGGDEGRETRRDDSARPTG